METRTAPATSARPSHENFRENAGILMQFLLFELIQACGHMRHLSDILRHAPENLLPLHWNSITSSVACLAGSSQRTVRLFTHHLNEGILAQLKDYAAYFSHSAETADSSTLELERHASRAWVHALDCLDRLRELEKQGLNSRNFRDFNERFLRMQHRIAQFSSAIHNILPEFSRNENVLFFLLSHKSQLDMIFGKDAIAAALINMFPEGLDHMERFLSQRYNARGFIHLLPVISKKIAEIDIAYA